MSAQPINPEPSEAKLIAEEARRLFALGVLTFPASRTAKHPDRVKHWAAEHYPADGWPTAQQHSEMFSHHDVARMFVVCGARSGNVASFDFDQAGYFEQWASLLPDELYDRLYVEQSQRSGGYHVAVKTTESVLSCCPARDPRKPDGTDGNIRIEMRGEGTGFTAAPSVGYQRIQGDLAALPMLTPDEYRMLIDAAVMFNECAPRPQPERKARTVRPADEDELPGTRYNRESSQSDVLDLFARHGWTIGRRSGDTVSITRPGATSESSGNVNADGVTHIFSSNTPFEPSVAGHGNPHAPFAAYAILEHGGDYHAAAKTLYAQYTPPAVRIAEAHNLDVDLETGAILAPSPPDTKADVNTDADTPPPERPYTDLGNAERLGDKFGNRIRYCASLDTWLIWDGMRWCADKKREIYRFAAATSRLIYSEAADADTAEQRAAIAKHAVRSEGAARIEAMVSLARSLSGVAVTADQLDADRWLLNVMNGTIDLGSGKLRDHDPADLITKLAPVQFDPDATLPLWETFIAETTGGDTGFAAFLRRAVGYTAQGEPTEEVIFFPHGPGASGKSTFLEALKGTLGDYAMTADFEAFVKKKGDGGIRSDIARLAGARLVVSIEVEDGKKLAEGLVKTISGGDTVTARQLYKKEFEFRPAFTLWLAANDAPKVRNDDDAMWRRIKRLPFTNIVPKENRDPKVKATLRDPAIAGPAILAWVVRGCIEWHREGLGVPPAIERATEAYRAEMDVLSGFLSDCCVERANLWESTSALYTAYDTWCKAGNEKTLTKTDFARQLGAHGFTEKRTSVARGWVGIGLRNAATQGLMGDEDA